MDIQTAIKTRKSTRAFLPKPVPEETVRELLETALRAPSASNTQPWEITVITGKVLDQIRRDNTAKVLAGTPLGKSQAYPEKFQERKVQLGKQLFTLMNIGREDREKRQEWQLRGFRFFDAPVAMILSIDRLLLGSWATVDIGNLAQTICLSALHHGLGTCIEIQGVAFQDVIRTHTGLPASSEIILGIALGYPDPAARENQFVSPRTPLDEVTTLLGF